VQLVVIEGNSITPDQIFCAEHLGNVADFFDQSNQISPRLLGERLKNVLMTRDLEPQCISFAVPDEQVTAGMVSLPAALSDQDVSFQLAAELLQNRWTEVDQFCVDYQLVDSVDLDADQNTYKAGLLEQAKVQACLQLAKTAALNTHAIETCQAALSRVQVFSEFLSQPIVTASGVLLCEEACGLALSAWADDEAFNFYPHRLELQQRLHRRWAFQLFASLGAGIVLAGAISAAAAYQTQRVVSAMKESFSVGQALQEIRKKHQQLQVDLDRQHQIQQWVATQSESHQRRHLLQAELSRLGVDVWISGLQVQQTSWVIQGEALRAESVHQALAQLSALPIWAQKPALENLQISSDSVTPVWGFKAVGELKGG
jgi:hypothetical protein